MGAIDREPLIPKANVGSESSAPATAKPKKTFYTQLTLTERVSRIAIVFFTAIFVVPLLSSDYRNYATQMLRESCDGIVIVHLKIERTNEEAILNPKDPKGPIDKGRVTVTDAAVIIDTLTPVLSLRASNTLIRDFRIKTQKQHQSPELTTQARFEIIASRLNKSDGLQRNFEKAILITQHPLMHLAKSAIDATRFQSDVYLVREIIQKHFPEEGTKLSKDENEKMFKAIFEELNSICAKSTQVGRIMQNVTARVEKELGEINEPIIEYIYQKLNELEPEVDNLPPHKLEVANRIYDEIVKTEKAKGNDLNDIFEKGGKVNDAESAIEYYNRLLNNWNSLLNKPKSNP